MLMNLVSPQIISVYVKFENKHIYYHNIDHTYFFIIVNLETKSMGINKKGAALAIGIIAFIICIGAGSG